MIRRMGVQACDERGSVATEFAIVAPVMLLLMMGLGELSFQGYVQSVLTGAVEKAARDSTIQGNDAKADEIDDKVKEMVRRVVPAAKFDPSERTNFDSYAAIAGEPFTDAKWPNNSSGVYDGICNHGESYTDVNNNGSYDLKLGATGQGGANDVTKYQMTMKYDRLFPIAGWIGWSNTVTLSAATILKNQPYATQTVNNGTNKLQCPA